MGYQKDEFDHWQVEWQGWAKKYAIEPPLKLGYEIAGLETELFTLPEALAYIESFYLHAPMEGSVQEVIDRVSVEAEERVNENVPAYAPEPPRVLTGNDLVVNPISSQSPSRADRMADYGARVGFQR